MNKALQRLRDIKAKAVKRMEELNAAARSENRDLTVAEQAEFESLKAQAATLATEIEELQKEDPTPAPVKVDVDQLKREATQAEQIRQSTIRERVAAAKLPVELANELCKDGNVTVDAASVRIFAELAKLSKENPKVEPHVQVTKDARDNFRAELTAGLLHRMDPSNHPIKEGLGRRFAGRSLMTMAEESLKAVGVRTESLTPGQIVEAALMGRNGHTAYLEGAGMHTTSDFPSILGDVANKRMRMAYEAAPKSFMPFSKRVTASDFKPMNVVQISDISQFQLVNEHGEFKSATLSDSKETYALKTYGEIVKVTRQTIVNDDLRAFDKLTQAIGTAAARLENETVWAIITSNPTMGDGTTLFHAANRNNLLSGAGSALALSGLASARAAMRLQKAPKGQVLNVTPAYIMVPAALETTALQLTVPNAFAANQFTNVIPEWIKTLTPIVEPLLDANSATAWYLAASPGTIDTIEYAYLEGQEGLYTEQKNGFEVDGIQIKGRLDFAAAAVEPRGLQRNAGV